MSSSKIKATCKPWKFSSTTMKSLNSTTPKSTKYSSIGVLLKRIMSYLQTINPPHQDTRTLWLLILTILSLFSIAIKICWILSLLKKSKIFSEISIASTESSREKIKLLLSSQTQDKWKCLKTNSITSMCLNWVIMHKFKRQIHQKSLLMILFPNGQSLTTMSPWARQVLI